MKVKTLVGNGATTCSLSAIPENGVLSALHSIDDQEPLGHRSPVSFANGYHRAIEKCSAKETKLFLEVVKFIVRIILRLIKALIYGVFTIAFVVLLLVLTQHDTSHRLVCKHDREINRLNRILSSFQRPKFGAEPSKLFAG